MFILFPQLVFRPINLYLHILCNRNFCIQLIYFHLIHFQEPYRYRYPQIIYLLSVYIIDSKAFHNHFFSILLSKLHPQIFLINRIRIALEIFPFFYSINHKCSEIIDDVACIQAKRPLFFFYLHMVYFLNLSFFIKILTEEFLLIPNPKVFSQNVMFLFLAYIILYKNI